MMQHTTPYFVIPIRKIFACALAVVMATTLCPLPTTAKAYADPIEQKRAEAAEVLIRLNAMQSTLDKLSTEYGDALINKEKAETERDAAKNRIVEINEQVQILQTRLKERAREVYRGGGVSVLDLILGAKSFEEFATSLDLVNKVNANDAAMVEERRVLKEEAAAQAQIFSTQARIASQKTNEAALATREAEAIIVAMQETYDNLSAEVAQMVEQKRQEQEAAEAERLRQEREQSGATDEVVPDPNNGQGSDEGKDPTPEEDDSNNNNNDDNNNDTFYEGGNDVISRAYACLGAPYVWGGVGPRGYDCSGLVSYALTGNHERLGTTGTFINWRRVDNPQPGDVAVIHQVNGNQHTGIYIGGGQMIHASTYGVGVIVGPVQAGMIFVRW